MEIDKSFFLEKDKPGKVTIKTMKEYATANNIALSATKKDYIFSEIKEHVSRSKTPIRNDEEPAFPSQGDMIKVIRDLEKGKISPTTKIIRTILIKLKKLGFENCGSWYKISTSHFIGGGVQGNVHRFNDHAGKTVLVSSKKMNEFNKVVSVEYNYINVIFAAIVKNIVEDGETPNLVVIEHIYKCESNKTKGLDIPKVPYILNIMDYMACGSLFDIRRSLDLKQRISIFLQVFSTTMILAANKIGHLDLHGNNILICKTNSKEIYYPMLDSTIPLFGCIAKIIDYDYVGIATEDRLFYDTPPTIDKLSQIFLSNANSYKKFPVAFILGQIYALRKNQGMVQETSQIWLSPVYKCCDYLNREGFNGLSGNLGLGYKDYSEVYKICLIQYQATVTDLLKKME